MVCGASASSVTLKPAVPATSALKLARASAAERQRAEQRACAERRREESERRRADVQRVGGEHGHEHVEVEADGAHDQGHDQHGADLRRVAGVPQPLGTPATMVCRAPRATGKSSSSRISASPASTARKLTALIAKQTPTLVRGDQHAGDRRPDHAGGVEQARVQRDRVRQLLAADHLEGQRVARRARRTRARCHRARRGRRPPRPSRAPEKASTASAIETSIANACVTIISRRLSKRSAITPGRQPEDRERHEAAEGEEADRHRRVRQVDDEPGERRVLHPRPDDGDDLAGEEEPVVAVDREGW